MAEQTPRRPTIFFREGYINQIVTIPNFIKARCYRFSNIVDKVLFNFCNFIKTFFRTSVEILSELKFLQLKLLICIVGWTQIFYLKERQYFHLKNFPFLH